MKLAPVRVVPASASSRRCGDRAGASLDDESVADADSERRPRPADVAAAVDEDRDRPEAEEEPHDPIHGVALGEAAEVDRSRAAPAAITVMFAEPASTIPGSAPMAGLEPAPRPARRVVVVRRSRAS